MFDTILMGDRIISVADGDGDMWRGWRVGYLLSEITLRSIESC